MRKLTVHETGKECNCLFCLTQCPQCGASFSLGFSASFDMAKSEDRILLHGSIVAMGAETNLCRPDFKPVCSECGNELPETRVVKLKKALFSAIGGNVRIDRKYDGVIEIGRSIHKRTAGAKGIKGNGGK